MTPAFVIKRIQHYRENRIINVSRLRNKKNFERIRQKDKIQVSFILYNVDSWKYNQLYWSLQHHQRFDPNVVLAPYMNKDKSFCQSEIAKSETFAQNQKYNYTIGYDKDTHQSFQPDPLMNADIVFHQNPITFGGVPFNILSLKNQLNCYIPYSIRIDTLYEYNYQNLFNSLTWINFFESDVHLSLSRKYARNNGENVVVLGHPQFDNLLLPPASDPWKIQTAKEVKRIIWAPHWTIKGYQTTGINWACFLDYADFFLEIAKKLKGKAQFAMKPHPFLRNILAMPELWGSTKTEAYFIKWENGENTQIVDGDYIDLFKTSDVLIHDSGSFMVEYMILNKRAAYTMNADMNPQKEFNDYGQIALGMHTIVKSTENLKLFIESIVEGDSQHQTSTKGQPSLQLLIPPRTHETVSESITYHLNNILC